jgi:glycosyltransferase involved in cell wall biosynthesis
METSVRVKPSISHGASNLGNGPLARRVVCIVPAYNESGRIGKVLAGLRQVDRLDAILVVDDGSLDSTLSEARTAAQNDPRVRVLHHESNRGKGSAVLSGLSAAEVAGAIVLLDADLEGFTPLHIQDLIEPVLHDQAEMTVGLFVGGKWTTDMSHHLTPWLSGQRCLRGELLHRIDWHAAEGYGIETALTVAALQDGWRVQRVPMPGVWHPLSEYHRGLGDGIRNRARMYAQIARAWYRAGGVQWIFPRLRDWVRRAFSDWVAS